MILPVSLNTVFTPFFVFLDFVSRVPDCVFVSRYRSKETETYRIFPFSTDPSLPLSTYTYSQDTRDTTWYSPVGSGVVPSTR